MPKIKTHRGAAKRFSLTKSGKVKGAAHTGATFLTKKTTEAEKEALERLLMQAQQTRQRSRN